jgi:hypothetical protein
MNERATATKIPARPGGRPEIFPGRYNGNHFRAVLLAVALLLAVAFPARAFDLDLAVGGGYDDNPRELEKASGSAFSEARLAASHTLASPALPELTLTLDGFAGGRIYERCDNTWMAGGGLTGAAELTLFPGRLELFSQAATYNNPEIDDDNFDQLRIGGRLVWFATPQLTLEWENALGWEDYDSDDEVTGHPHPGGSRAAAAHDRKNPAGSGNPALPPGHRPPRHHNQGERSDRTMATALRAFYALNPYWELSGETFWQSRHSSLDAEKNHSYGLQLGLFWHPLDNLDLNLSANAARTPYHYDLRQQERTEKSYASILNLEWKFARHWSLSGSWEWFRQDSDIDPDEYTRNQWYAQINFSY